MNRIVITALAIATASGVAHATTGGDSEWLKLDREIGRLASEYAPRDGGDAGLGALLRVFYGYTDDDVFNGGTDVSGVELLDTDVWLEGEVGDFDWRVSLDLKNGTAETQDAYASWNYEGGFAAIFGQYKPNVMRSASIDPENTFFSERTIIGAGFDYWDAGLGASGVMDAISWFINVMNGGNGSDTDHFWNVRVEFDLADGAGEYEGAYGGGDELDATVGVTYWKDDTQFGDTMGYGVDLWGSSGPIGFGAEVIDIDDDFSLAGFGSMANIWSVPSPTFGLEANSTPYNATVTWAFDEQFEAGIRYQDMDNTDDTTLISAGINYYKSGHNAKWHAAVHSLDSDTDDGTFFTAGLTLGSTH